jgi:hypothetical protein
MTKKPAKKTQPRKASVSKTKRNTPKKAATKKATPKKATPKKATPKKSVPKKTARKKATPKKPTAKKTAPTKQSTSKARQAKRSTRDTGTGGGDVWLLDVPYELRTTAKYGGAKWDFEKKRWFYTGEELPHKLAHFASHDYSWERWMEDEENGHSREVPGQADIKLRPHQTLAAEAMSSAFHAGLPGYLLADDVGLGKTYSTIDGINKMGSGLNVLILSPLSVVAHWRRSIAAMGSRENRWCVINYDRVKKLLEAPPSDGSVTSKKRTINKKIATKGTGLVEWDVVILDEAHKLKNPTSQRTSATRRVIAAGSGAFCVYLSATAGQNPLELSYLSPLLADATGVKVKDLKDFEGWCKAQGFGVTRGAYGQWNWKRDERDLLKIRDMLFSTSERAMRRRPQDLAGWPELQRILFPQELDPVSFSLYEEAWEEFRRTMEMDPKGKDSPSALVAALRLRQKASLLRCKHTSDLCVDLLEQGYQVAVSVQFIETSKIIEEHLRKAGYECSIINGQVTAQAREQERVSFQRGEKRVTLFTVTEGISLHAGEQAVSANDAQRVLLLHDLRWSALDVAQIEGRCHRDGQNAAVWYLFAPETAEERVANAVLAKLEDMGNMLGDDMSGLEALWSLL